LGCTRYAVITETTQLLRGKEKKKEEEEEEKKKGSLKRTQPY